MTKKIWGLITAASVVFFSCQKKPAPPTPPTPVNEYTVKKQYVFYYDKYPSTTQAFSQVNIYPQVQGYITGIFFKEGAHVRKGQELYEIDRRLYLAAVDQAKANLKVAHGTTVQSQEDEDRYAYLNKYNAVAKQLYDHAVITLENSVNSEKAANEGVRTAETNLAFSVINAPFDGTIGFSQVKLGNMVTVGQTVLNTISTDNPMAVDFLVNEKQLPQFERIYNDRGKQIDSLFTILLPDNTLYPYAGEISNIDRAVDNQTGAIRVRLSFPNPEYLLKVGMSTVVRVHNEDTAPQMVIPNKAVVEQMGEYFVFIDKDTLMAPRGEKGKDEKDSAKAASTEQKVPTHVAEQKKVMLGQTVGPNVIVKSGIEEGDKVIIDGVQLLHDGSRIAPGQRSPTDTTGANHMQGTTIESKNKN